MLQDIPTPTLRETRPVVLETSRLILRKPVLGDAKTIAKLANDRRVGEMTRRLPHPYLQQHAMDFISAVGADSREIVFLVEYESAPVGVVGIDRKDIDAPELGYWFGVEHWGQGFGTEAARAVIDFAFEEYEVDALMSGARVVNPASRHVLEKCGFQWIGVELHRFEALGSSTPVDRFRLTRSVWSSLKTWSSSTRRMQ